MLNLSSLSNDINLHEKWHAHETTSLMPFSCHCNDGNMNAKKKYKCFDFFFSNLFINYSVVYTRVLLLYTDIYFNTNKICYITDSKATSSTKNKINNKA